MVSLLIEPEASGIVTISITSAGIVLHGAFSGSVCDFISSGINATLSLLCEISYDLAEQDGSASAQAWCG